MMTTFSIGSNFGSKFNSRSTEYWFPLISISSNVPPRRASTQNEKNSSHSSCNLFY